jgi:hypothetical protein
MSHLSSSTNEVVSAPSITIARPAGANASHILVAAIWCDAWAPGGITAPGWTRALTYNHTAYAASELALFLALGDVAALTFNLQAAAGSANIRGLVSAFAGRDLGAPLGDLQVAESINATTSVPSLTALAGDDAFCTWADFQAAISGPITGGAPAGFTDRFNDNTPAELHVIGSTADGLSAGPTGVLSRACGNFTAKIAGGLLIKAAGGGGGGGGSANVVIM